MDAASGGTGWSELFLERRLLIGIENAAQLMQLIRKGDFTLGALTGPCTGR